MKIIARTWVNIWRKVKNNRKWVILKKIGGKRVILENIEIWVTTCIIENIKLRINVTESIFQVN